MIAVDANLLVYAHDASSPDHRLARDWLEAALGATARVALPWTSLLAFLRIVTNPRIYRRPQSLDRAWAQVDKWLSAEPSWIPVPGQDHQAHLGRMLSVSGLRANDVPDAHLAALCLEHGLRLATHDGGFARFPRLSWFDPLD